MKKQTANQTAPSHFVVSNVADIAAAHAARQREIAGITKRPAVEPNPMGWGVRFDHTQTGIIEDRRGVEGLIAAGKPGAAAVYENPWIYMNDEPIECAKPNQGAC
jgi:hypothetical protein